ncbi:Retrovirus-related Pol polyprotein from transposon TNT 1-94 [Vitis vinifera]|uniref:Retrovirus-related Pol polyprotein from transposon TNT 1-94 n=1 Tax=Vitis vinifera TaxID=29760 RepID=A0A438CCX8_VITVI|nr:Retrovirus-related Pol polyprotein from transposon TNT 1-94 [Vitis vinifera]
MTPFWCRASSSRLVRRRLALLSLRQSSPNPTSPFFFGISAFAGLLSASSGLRRHLPSLAETGSLRSKRDSISGEVDMATKNPIFTSVISGSPTITSEKLIGSENYLSWSASVDLLFMGQGYEDHLVTPEDVIPDVDKMQWKKIDAQLCSDMDLSTYIGRIASLKEEFLTLMPFTNGAEAQQIETDKFFMVLTLIGLRPDLEFIRDQILASPSVPSLDDVFARLLRLSSTQTLSIDGPSDSSLHGRPPRTAHIAQSSDPLLSRPDSAAATSAFVTFVAQTGNVSVCFTQSPSLGSWILDSGASDHISGNKHLFSFITTTSVLPTVTLANGSQTIAKGIDLAHPLPSLPLHSVLYAPECPFNLISISKITHTLNCFITFSDKSAILQDRSTGKTIGIERESQGLYHLTSPSSPAACISTDAPLLIHTHLGHPSLSKFQKMVPRFSTLSSLACELCQLGKHTHVSFPKHLNNRAKSPFELVHTDVWGPCRTTSTLGFQYFDTFIDDYSRCTRLFLMKNRAELFSIFQKFYAEIQTQFNVSIQVLRSDNAREYFSTPFTSFMFQYGILHQSSCAHTPQQNGVAERNNRYLVETARTLLLHSHVLFHFWGDAVLTTCYLINHKLSAKAMKCIFLGYSRFQKGYRCYSPNTHRYFLSIDVNFFEDSPFFSSSESLPISEVLALPYISPPSYALSRPLQVYHRRHRVVAPPLSSAEVPNDSPPVPTDFSYPDPVIY